LFVRDENTNALIPLVALEDSISENDKIVVRENKLYKIDEETNALVPILTGVSSGGEMMLPDYNNMESVNRLNGQGSSWTVDRVGFVRLIVRIVGSSGNPTKWLYHYINDRKVGEWGWGGASTPSLTWSTGNISFMNVYPVSAGDVVRVSSWENVDNVQEAYFIPPKFIKKELPVVIEKNGSYSLDEIKTADTWIDGKPIYKKTLYFPALSNMSEVTQDVSALNAELFIEIKGFYYGGDSINPIPYVDTSLTGMTAILYRTLTKVIAIKNPGIDLSDRAAYVTVKYTKITD
jgi:hypothetical protein